MFYFPQFLWKNKKERHFYLPFIKIVLVSGNRDFFKAFRIEKRTKLKPTFEFLLL